MNLRESQNGVLALSFKLVYMLLTCRRLKRRIAVGEAETTRWMAMAWQRSAEYVHADHHMLPHVTSVLRTNHAAVIYWPLLHDPWVEAEDYQLYFVSSQTCFRSAKS